MKFAIIILACLACVGCVTTVETRWSDGAGPGAAELEAAQKQMQQWKAGLEKMNAEIIAAPNEIEAVNAVLKKYGISRTQ